MGELLAPSDKLYMVESPGSVDRVTEFPDLVLHKILEFLPCKDAARTCILSKRWHHIWETFPVLDFNQDFFGKQLRVAHPKGVGIPKDERRMIFKQRVKFMSYIDYKLRRLCEESLCIKKFRLDITLVNINLAPKVDKWLELITDLGVQELDLDIVVAKHRFYALPWKVLETQSLIILTLRGCFLSRCVSSNAIKLKYLIELNLHCVFMDEDTIRNLICCCRSMELLSLDFCWGFKRLEICSHDKIKKIMFRSEIQFRVEKFIFEILSLEELDFSIDGVKDMEHMFEVSSACQNLKRLSLTSFPTCGKWVQKMISPFSLLEYLFLRGCDFQGQVFKIASTILKEVRFQFCKNMVEVEIDAPNLHTFKYVGSDMPCLLSSDVAGNREATIFPSSQGSIDNSWFMRLSNFLRCGRFQDFILCIYEYDFPITFDAQDLIMGDQLPPPVELENLELTVQTLRSVNCTALLDGLLCTLRPKVLSLELNYVSTEFVQRLLKRLILRNSDDCPEGLECWRDSLKDIKFIGLKGRQFDVPLDPSALEQLKFYGEKHGNGIDSSVLKSLEDFVDTFVMQATMIVNVKMLYIKLSW